ncbi:MAG: amidohydrolase family protein [Planctomycetes bacterium]|nr:amidohydrolase family protein [Planctomycetota bacterium]
MSRTVRAAAFWAAVGLSLALAPANAQEEAPVGETLYLHAQTLHTGRVVLHDAVLVIRGGKVVQTLPVDEVPAGAKVLRRAVVAPGFVLTELRAGFRRTEESLGARYLAIDGFDPHSQGHSLLSSGITTAFLHPGSRGLASGQGAVVKLGGPAAGRVLRSRAELCLNAGSGGMGAPYKFKIPFPSSSDVPILPAIPQRPLGRSGIVPEIAAKLRAALAYSRARQGPAATRPELDPNLAALAEAVLDGRLRFEANRVDELKGLIRLLRELGLEPVISGGLESYKVLEDLAGLGSGVIYRLPYGISSRRDRGERRLTLQPRWDTPRRLAQAGVPFAFAPPSGEAKNIRLAAALSVRGGLSRSAALAAITRQAAQLLGVGERVGHLGRGADADFVVLSGDPLATSTQVRETWISGQLVFDARAPLKGKRPPRALVVRAGLIVTGAGPVIRNGAVLVIDGQIAAVGSSVPVPRGARVVDAGPDAVVTAGFVDGYGHLGLQGGGGRELERAPLSKLIGSDRSSTRRVARAGVTTVVLGARSISRGGGRLGAIKTLGTPDLQDDLRRGFLLKEVVASAIDLSREDPLGKSPKALQAKLAAAKRAVAAWAKYRKALAKWKGEQAKKKAKARADLVKKRRPRAKKDSKKADEAKKKADEAKKKADAAKKKGPEKKGDPKKKPKKKFDPISGTWEFTMSGGPLPEPREGGQMLLKLEPDGKTITGVAKPPGGLGDDAPITGTLDGKEIELNLEVDSPFGKPKIKATLDGEDHFTGKLLLGPLSLDVDATRIERSVPVIKIEIRRGKSKDGRPEPPTAAPALDGFRLALEGKAPLLVRVAHPRVALAILKLAKAYKIRVVFVEFADADLIADEIKAAGAGVLVRPEASVVRGGRRVNMAADLAARGIPFAFMSQSGDGAEWLPLRAIGAVADGLDPGAALGALTINSARMLGISDRVGSLEVGKDGDLLIFNGAPLEATTRLERVFVRGREVPAEKE